MKNIFLIISTFLATSICSQNYVADFALYDPVEENDGVWEEEVTTLKAMFFAYGWSYKAIDANDINSGILWENSNLNFKALVSPGGWAFHREVVVSQIGEEHIREFINKGGNYIGFCAGSFWASDTVSWAQNSTGGNNEYNQESDYIDYNYNLNIFNGIAKGPFGWTKWSSGDTASYQIAKINNNNETMNTIGLHDTTRFFYYGGPYFICDSNDLDNYEIWATSVAPNYTDENAKMGVNEPSIIKYTYGNGNVILFSYHPEVLIKSIVDNIKLNEFFNEDDFIWKKGTQSFDEINLDSWNIVHAALQIANNEQVTKIISLPAVFTLKVFLQGAYNDEQNTMNVNINNFVSNMSPYFENQRKIINIPENIIDWVLIELRESIHGNSILKKSILLRNDGKLVNDEASSDLILVNIPNGEYYIVIKHRNHLPIISNAKLDLN